MPNGPLCGFNLSWSVILSLRTHELVGAVAAWAHAARAQRRQRDFAIRLQGHAELGWTDDRGLRGIEWLDFASSPVAAVLRGETR
jgi:hypothetical protein